MSTPYLVLTEPLSQKTAPCSAPYNRKALALVALLSTLGGVALWTQLAGGEQQASAIDMPAFAQPIKAQQMLRQPIARSPMPMSWGRPVQSQPYLPPLRATEAAKEKIEKPTAPPFSPQPWLEDVKEKLKNPEKYMVKFGGSTGGLLLNRDEVYIMTWIAPKEAIFEMPMGGAAVMNAGDNLVKLTRKEHGIALGTMLRQKFKVKDYRIFCLFPNGEIQFLHPKDGVFPEKVNKGRVGVNSGPDSGSILNPQFEDLGYNSRGAQTYQTNAKKR